MPTGWFINDPFGGQGLWRDLWASDQTKTVTVYHVTGHLPLASPGNDEADTLAPVRWLEGKPVPDVAQWLHQVCCMQGKRQCELQPVSGACH